MYPELSTPEIVAIAKKHLPELPEAERIHNSAWSCFVDAEKQLAFNDMDGFRSARMWALKSLAYSVGVFHPDYQKVKASM